MEISDTYSERLDIQKITKVLVVEDQEINQILMKKLFKRKGIDFVIVNNGKEALDVCINEAFDLVFMDCQMPIMDGYETTRTIRKLEQNGKHTPIIAMTANALSGDREKCIDCGMDCYLSKPIEINEVYKIIDMIEKSMFEPSPRLY